MWAVITFYSDNQAQYIECESCMMNNTFVYLLDQDKEVFAVYKKDDIYLMTLRDTKEKTK